MDVLHAALVIAMGTLANCDSIRIFCDECNRPNEEKLICEEDFLAEHTCPDALHIICLKGTCRCHCKDGFFRRTDYACVPERECREKFNVRLEWRKLPGKENEPRLEVNHEIGEPLPEDVHSTYAILYSSSYCIILGSEFPPLGKKRLFDASTLLQQTHRLAKGFQHFSGAGLPRPFLRRRTVTTRLRKLRVSIIYY
ncbi:uncharacterized protein LOC144100608 isoform X1 [Amblyomma americanum]